MSLKKKKNLLIIGTAVIGCFTIYQLYFFLAITAENANSSSRVIHVIDHSNIMEVVHIRSEDDKFINENGVLKGVLFTNMPRYRPDSKDKFTCITSGQQIPFEQVNDDYCDCEDSSDEPSTTACTNGTFYCDTQFKNKPISLNYISSGMVNDGICDCCDGSDEWLHGMQRLLTQGSEKLRRHYADKCPNICYMLDS